ncbi:MAG: hypothetical protein VKQ33_01855 [Candidatus Sericytochromatia bacterium]|nr:hypothetical protein [Candidatus Sericytochromatia bacterium]
MTPMAPLPPVAPLAPPPPAPPGALPAPTVTPQPGPAPLPPGAPLAPDAAAFRSPAGPAPASAQGGSLEVDLRGLAGLYNAIYTGLKAPALRSLSGSLQRALPLMKRAALVQAIASGIKHGLDLMQGRASAGTAVARFTNDTLGAFAGGTGAALLAGGLVGLFGATGAMAGVVGVVGGLLGYGLGQSLLSATGIPGLVSRAIHGVLGA